MDLTKALDFLEKQGLDDCHYQDSGMMEHIAENMKKYADQQLILSGVSCQRGQLPKRLSNEAYNKAKEMSYEDFVKWWDKQKV